ncbi:MAG: copper chaperone PCu(A)C [Gemmatimonadaceae bacterium]
MTRLRFSCASTCVAVMLFSVAACRRDTRTVATSFELHDAWVRSDPDSGSTTAAYIRFVNGTPDTVVVSKFSSDDAQVVELHETSIDANGEARMDRRDTLVIAPSHIVVMRPGGYHLMLIGITHSLQPGAMVRIAMHLSNGAIVSTSARVKD